jgi:ABC-2 type transport system permease protein
MSGLAAPPLREIRGPSAYGGGLRRFVDLTWLIALSEFRLAYFGSTLGYLWSLMRPLLLFGVLYVVFSEVVRFGDDIPNYPVLLLLNIVLFNFFQEATGRSVTCVVDREGLVRKMHFPRMVIPVSVVVTAVLNLLTSLLAVFVFMLIYGVEPRWTWLLLPLVVLPLVAFATGIAMLLSSLYPRYRDVSPIWVVIAQVLFYASPIFYTIDKVPESFRTLAMSNPIAAILEQARHWIIDPSAPGAVSAIGGWPEFLIPCAVLVGIVALGLFTFEREAPRVAEQL